MHRKQRTSITLDESLWREFKAVCALEGKDMSAVLEQFINDYIQAHKTARREALEHNQEETR
jgi:metal-responsive CopG/Arc/MetJ family transcriptional regulator